MIKIDKFLLLDFCNIKNLTLDEILSLQIRHKISHTIAGELQGYEDYCRSIRDPKKRWFWLVENKVGKDMKDKASESTKYFIVLPSDKESNDVINFFKLSQNEYKQFLDNYIKGSPDISFINKLKSYFKLIKFEYIKSNNDWSLEIVYDEEEEVYIRTFEDYVNWEIFRLFLTGQGKIFSQIKKCKWCSSYFLYRRKDQKYCSEKCSSNCRGSRFDEEHPDYRKEYVKKGRKEGRYQ